MTPAWDTARYVLALLTLVTLVPGLLFWPMAHGLVGWWRRLGLTWSYAVLGAYVLSLGIAVFSLRQTLLAVEFGTQPWLFAPALACLGGAAAIDVHCRRFLSLRTMVGVPELSGARSTQPLLDQGIYTRLRHPRYAALLLGVCAAAFASNYLALYLLCPGVMGLLYGITLMEERELVDRFGEEYRKYQQRVPRFFPGFGPKR